MAEFSVISDVSNEILKLIRERVCPELIQSPEAVLLAAPSDKKTDFQLGLYLYDIQELREYQSKKMLQRGNDRAQFPPKPLNLFYAVYLNSRSQMMASSENEQRILGKVMQILMDERLTYEDAANGEKVSITLLPLSFEEKTKIWSVLNEPYQLAVYFSVTPVLLDSKKQLSFQRVVAADFNVQMERKDRR